eukprot:3278461-Prorocentrum_lima.AAC.1
MLASRDVASTSHGCHLVVLFAVGVRRQLLPHRVGCGPPRLPNGYPLAPPIRRPPVVTELPAPAS